MMTVRATITSALTKWLKNGDPMHGALVMVKLTHQKEGGTYVKVDAWPTSGLADISTLAIEIEDLARSVAANCPGGIVESFALFPYFGGEKAEGGYRPFSIQASVADAGDEGSGVGTFSEGATDRGQRHQGMRHIEAMARIYVDGNSRLHSERESLLTATLNRLATVETANSVMRNEVEEAKDRSVERQLAVYRMYEDEKRTTKLYEGLIPAIGTLANAAAGAPLFPVSSEDAGVNAFKNLIRSLTMEQMKALQKDLSPEQYIPIVMAKEQIMAEDDTKEKREEAEANKKIGHVMSDPEVQKILARRDEKGIPREPLGPAPEGK